MLRERTFCALVSALGELAAWDKARGELTLLGRRQVAVDAESLCRDLNALVGVRVAEVIMNNHQVRLGREDAARVRREKPEASVQEIVGYLVEADWLSGLGVTTVTFPEDSAEGIFIEVSNPAIKGTTGAAKAFVFSYWSAVLSFLLGKQLDARDVTYDERRNLLVCQITLRSSK
jgi:hypothetical protein